MKQRELEKLLQQMTLSEKIGQLVQLTPQFFDQTGGEITGPLGELGMDEQELYQIGSVLGTHTKEQVKEIQKRYLEKSRLGIPLIFMADVIHGYEIIFPVPLALASSWQPELVEKMAELSALEASRAGIHVTFSPMVDLVRDARWGRVMESTGEDSYLNSCYAESFVKGYQGSVEELSQNSERIAACAKHFVGYGAAEGGRDYNTVDLSDWSIYQNYLPSFKAAIEAGARLVMTSFNTIRGIPSTANKWLLKEVLRKDLSFNGLVISDWAAVEELINHGVALDKEEAAYKAIEAGCDMDMMSNCYISSLEHLVRTQKVSEELINKACLQVLMLKNELGLFENPYRGLEREAEWEKIDDCLREASRQIASQSLVLLKNEENILPLNNQDKIALVGPFAESQDVLGAWSWIGKKQEAVSFAQGLQNTNLQLEIAGTKDRLVFSSEEYEQMLSVSKQADIVIVAVGESSEESGEATSKGNIQLPASHEKLICEVASLGKKVIVVLFNGRPLVLTNIVDKVDAIVEVWFPGTEAGSAIADVLTGKVSPTGKLPVSFPYAVGQVPIYYNELRTGRPCTPENADQGYISKYLDLPNTPLFPFGYGLTYGKVTVDSVKLNNQKIKMDETLKVAVQCKNHSNFSVTETIQLYVKDESSEVTLPKKSLKKFERIILESKEELEIVFELTAEDLAYCHSDLSWSSDSGEFTLFVGLDSETGLTDTFYLE